MSDTDEIVVKETTVKQRREVMDGELKPDEVKSGRNLQRPKATHLKTFEWSKKDSGEMEEASEKGRTGEVKEGESQTKLKKRAREKGRDVSGDGRMSGEKRGRKDGGNEKALDVKESQVLKKSRGQEDSKVA